MSLSHTNVLVEVERPHRLPLLENRRNSYPSDPVPRQILSSVVSSTHVIRPRTVLTKASPLVSHPVRGVCILFMDDPLFSRFSSFLSTQQMHQVIARQPY